MRLFEPCRVIRLTCAAIAMFIVCAGGTQAQSHDSQKPDLQQLEDKLQQLDQEMQELKGQINAAEQARSAPNSKPETPSAPAATQSQSETVPLEGEATERKNTIDMYGFVMLDSGSEFQAAKSELIRCGASHPVAIVQR